MHYTISLIITYLSVGFNYFAVGNSAISSKPVPANSVTVSTPVSRHYEQGHQQPPRYQPTSPYPLVQHRLEPTYAKSPAGGPHSDGPKPLLSAPWSDPSNPAPQSSYNNPSNHTMSNDPILHSVTLVPHDHMMPEQPLPWLNEPRPNHHYAMPETPSRIQGSSYNGVRHFSPSSSVPYEKGSPHLTDYIRDENRSSSSTSYRSGSGTDWHTSPGGSSVIDSWHHLTHNGAGNGLSDLFPLVYANTILSSYSPQKDKRHSDHYHSNMYQDKSHSDHYHSNNHHRR